MNEVVRNRCWECLWHYTIPHNAHVGCSKPDPDMTGNEHGIKNGWFNYPYCFDPIWMTKVCPNFTRANPVNDLSRFADAIGGVVQQVEEDLKAKEQPRARVRFRETYKAPDK